MCVVAIDWLERSGAGVVEAGEWLVSGGSGR